MKTLRVYDPPMCCSTGVCGPNVNSELVSFAGTLNGLKKVGVDVERFNLSQQPDAFILNSFVKDILVKKGQGALPIIFLNDEVIFEGRYPSRNELLDMVKPDSEIKESKCCDGDSKCCSRN